MHNVPSSQSLFDVQVLVPPEEQRDARSIKKEYMILSFSKVFEKQNFCKKTLKLKIILKQHNKFQTIYKNNM